MTISAAHPPHPSLPEELRGAIDLTDPIQVILSQFSAMMIQQKGIALVLIGLTADGNVAVTFHAPTGGSIQALGLLTAATGMIANRQTKETPNA